MHRTRVVPAWRMVWCIKSFFFNQAVSMQGAVVLFAPEASEAELVAPETSEVELLAPDVSFAAELI